MNVLYINDTDLFARNYNGYNLLELMNNSENSAKMIVKRKTSKNQYVKSVGTEKGMFLQTALSNYNNLLSFESNLYSNGCLNDILQSEEYINADIVHIHITFLYFLSFYDYNKLFSGKKIVITLHDTWFLTGGCTHNFDCENYKLGCETCNIKKNEHDNNEFTRAKLAFEYKLKLIEENDVSIIYASNLMGEYFKSSKTASFVKHHTKIPFGIESKEYISSKLAKEHFDVTGKFVIGFRNEVNLYKGCKYIFEALKDLDEKEIVIMTVSKLHIPEEIKNKYECINLGVVKDLELMSKFYSACDIFLMPSTSETFGVMAIEAMSNGTPVLCFKDTVVEDVTFANENCGIAVEKFNANEIADKLEYFINNRSELEERGKLGYKLAKEYYSIENYFNKHIEFYNKILNE